MAPKSDSPVLIEDIRRDRSGVSVLDELRTGLRPPYGGEKRMPTLLLYDEQGLKLFEDITYLDEYYLTNDEIAVLQSHATTIAMSIPEGCAIVELGSGYDLTLSKQKHLRLSRRVYKCITQSSR